MPSGSPRASAASQAGPVCPACGHQNLPDDRFCDNCGASLAAPAGAPANAASASPRPAEAPAEAEAGPEVAAPKGEPGRQGAPAAPEPAKIAASDLPTAEQPVLSSEAA